MPAKKRKVAKRKVAKKPAKKKVAKKLFIGCSSKNVDKEWIKTVCAICLFKFRCATISTRKI